MRTKQKRKKKISKKKILKKSTFKVLLKQSETKERLIFFKQKFGCRN